MNWALLPLSLLLSTADVQCRLSPVLCLIWEAGWTRKWEYPDYIFNLFRRMMSWLEEETGREENTPKRERSKSSSGRERDSTSHTHVSQNNLIIVWIKMNINAMHKNSLNIPFIILKLNVHEVHSGMTLNKTFKYCDDTLFKIKVTGIDEPFTNQCNLSIHCRFYLRMY